MSTTASPARVTVYTTPTCPWCVKAKDYLRKEGVAFQERDVSVDRQAAQEMVSRTRQMGVPVIADEQEAIVGFDLPRLQKMAARNRSAGGLGLRVADATDSPGAYVGGVKPDSVGERAGVLVGDVIEELSGRPVTTAADLEKIARLRVPGQPTSLMLRRGEERKTLILFS